MTDDARADSEVLIRLRAEPELIGVLYERHATAVFRYLARRAGVGAAEDLLSEVFVSALQARKRVVPHGSGSALPWLYGIAANALRRHLRSTTTHKRGWGPDSGADWDDVDSRLDAQAQRQRLRTALDVLSDSERELLLLVAWEELTPAEAAAALGISKLAARSRLHRARQRALGALAPEHDNASPFITDLLTDKE